MDGKSIAWYIKIIYLLRQVLIYVQAATPAFQRSMPVNLFGNLAHHLFEVIDESEGPIEIFGIMARYSFDAITMAGFGKK